MIVIFDIFVLVAAATRDLNVCDLSDNRAFDDDCSAYDQSWGPMIYIFMSQFISGIGTTLFSTLGITYLDDNVKRKQTPMLIGELAGARWRARRSSFYISIINGREVEFGLN